MQRAYGFAYQSPALTAAPSATVTVYNNGTLVLATIYADNLLTPKANPFTADATTAYWFWYGANGRYDVKITPIIGTPYTLGDVDLNDIFTLNGLTASSQTLVVGSAGTAFNIVDTAPGIHTFNLPDASATADGTINTGAQTIAGAKTFTTPIAIGSGGTGLSTSPTNGQLLIGSTGVGYVLAGLTGTANQITVTPGAGTITLAAAQSIGTGSSPTFVGLTLSGLIANSFLYSGAAGALATTAAPTNGQLLIGSTGAAPVVGSIAAGSSGNLTVTLGAGTITIDTPTIGITSLNGLTSTAAPTQTFTTGTSGSDFNISSSGTSHTFNIPDTAVGTRGLVNTGAQTIVGQKTFNTSPQYEPGGATTGPATVSGVVNAQVSVAGVSSSNNVETTFFTFNLPANALNAAGKAIRIITWGTNANAVTHTVRVYFGATVVMSMANGSAAQNWHVQAVVAYATGTTQASYGFGTVGTTASGLLGAVTTTSPTETLTGAVTVKVTGQGTNTGDLLGNGFIVEVIGS